MNGGIWGAGSRALVELQDRSRNQPKHLLDVTLGLDLGRQSMFELPRESENPRLLPRRPTLSSPMDPVQGERSRGRCCNRLDGRLLNRAAPLLPDDGLSSCWCRALKAQQRRRIHARSAAD
jgi:hypothetical protein